MVCSWSCNDRHPGPACATVCWPVKWRQPTPGQFGVCDRPGHRRPAMPDGIADDAQSQRPGDHAGACTRAGVGGRPHAATGIGRIGAACGVRADLSYRNACAVAVLLAGCRRVDPIGDVDVLSIPPPQMPEALASGLVDGYCSGEPWATVAEAQGTGRRVIRSGGCGLAIRRRCSPAAVNLQHCSRS